MADEDVTTVGAAPERPTNNPSDPYGNESRKRARVSREIQAAQQRPKSADIRDASDDDLEEIGDTLRRSIARAAAWVEACSARGLRGEEWDHLQRVTVAYKTLVAATGDVEPQDPEERRKWLESKANS